MRKLDNTAQVFSLDEKKNNNTFRIFVVLKEKVDAEILKLSVNKTIDLYPSYKVKIKSGFFWNYLENNEKEVIVEKDKNFKNIDFEKNNDYLFKVTYFDNKINLDIFHVLTDGLGAISFLKEIVSNYLNLKYNLKIKNKKKKEKYIYDQNLKNVDKKSIGSKYYKKAFIIKEKATSINKTYHYVLDLKKFKSICKKYNVSISEYLTALYIYTIYKTIYIKSSNKDIVVSIPIDLRKYYNVESFSNFFTCMTIEGNVSKNKTFEEILNQVHKEFENKLTLENIKKYLARDVKLGTNIGIRLIPLCIKKIFMKYFGELVNQISTTTLSNIGSIKFEKKYKKYIDNVIALVSTSKHQKVKCTICSYENNLTLTINSSLIDNKIEDEFYELLKEHIGKIKLESNVI